MSFPDSPAFKVGALIYHKTEETPGIVTALVYRESGIIGGNAAA